MASTVNALSIFLTLLVSISPSLAAKKPFRPHAVFLPVTKDASTNQYLTQIKQRTPLVPAKLTVDLGGQFLWVDCDKGYVSSSYKPVHCGTKECKKARSFACGDCFNGPKPGCNNNTCTLMPYNPTIRTSTSGEVAQDVISIQSTDGSNPGKVVSAPNFIFTCGSTSLTEGLAKGVKGIAGLGRGFTGLPSQLAIAFGLPRKFAVCLSSSTSSKGVIFFGDGPYNFLPFNEVSKSLMYTPLFVNPVSTSGSFFQGEKSVEYFIGVKAIKINGKAVKVNTTLLTINKEGNGGTKISTINPYTVLERSIYNAVTNAFASSLAKVPRVKAVAPFKVCYKASSLGSTRVGPGVPPIELVLQGNSTSWFIFGANSMVSVATDVLCLGFVDGGVNPTTSIVIGGHQIEDNLLQFDIENSRLGFTSSLYFQRTTCGNFNFTAKP